MSSRFFLKVTVVTGLLMFLVLGCARLSASQENASTTALKASIENILRKHGIFTGDNVEVAISDQVVVLTGTVQSLAQKVQAGLDASAAAKGYRVQNDLALAKTDLSPAEIAEKIAAALDKSPDYGIFDWCGMMVSSEGVVTLKGWVYYPSRAEKFVKIAQSQPGVTKVENELRPLLTSDSDNAIRLQAARAIYTRPPGPSFARMTGPIHILAENGYVTIAGTVKSEKDIEAFESLVRLSTGGHRVINELKVKTK